MPSPLRKRRRRLRRDRADACARHTSRHFVPALAWFPRVPLARERHIYTLGLWLASMRLRSAWTVPSPIRALLLGGAFNYTARRLIPTPTAASSTRACLAVTERHISDCCNDWPAPRVREALRLLYSSSPLPWVCQNVHAGRSLAGLRKERD